ncbi:uncharacterized protein FOMMEDRAFT_29207 [Fomitiporia mediterranea MF3/22]|uniref:uncharacterized protein n=1 Tax=Fomitiporia mediterranea (strain MF3/22) TaxID=694068 RepID=UPI0004407407|nr:uncharacterized protein FOMMEDRAFT_29207 [Fomitiporia mediterranea MF3/22]EJD02111.1 hypothetical protein FOMMEDRAFT_29207 [Fomitiporia mediterranea MF3/22]
MARSRRPRTRAQARSTGRQNSGVQPARRRTARRLNGSERSEHCCRKRGCKVTFARRSDLGRHLRTVHNKRAEIFECPFKSEGCDFSTKQKCNIPAHVDSVHLIRHEKTYHKLPGRRQRAVMGQMHDSEGKDDVVTLPKESNGFPDSPDPTAVGETSARSAEKGKGKEVVEDLSGFDDASDVDRDDFERRCGLYLPSELAKMQTETSNPMNGTGEPFVDRGTDGNNAMSFPQSMLINKTVWLYDALGQPVRPLAPADRQLFTNPFNANIGLLLGLEDAGQPQIPLAPPAPELENIPDYGAPLDFYAPFPDISTANPLHY